LLPFFPFSLLARVIGSQKHEKLYQFLFHLFLVMELLLAVAAAAAFLELLACSLVVWFAEAAKG